jgi:hypothetical protein
MLLLAEGHTYAEICRLEPVLSGERERPPPPS